MALRERLQEERAIHLGADTPVEDGNNTAIILGADEPTKALTEFENGFR